MNKENLLKQLNKLLVKKAEGFYYTEEAYEYTLETKKESVKQVSFFDDNLNADKEENNENKIITKISSKGVSKKQQNKNNGLKSGQEEILTGDIKEKIVQNENQQSLTLSKKKVTTHFVPPDMLAIKMLYEITSHEDNSDYDSLTDEEIKSLIKSLLQNSN